MHFQMARQQYHYLQIAKLNFLVNFHMHLHFQIARQRCRYLQLAKLGFLAILAASHQLLLCNSQLNRGIPLLADLNVHQDLN